MSGSDLRATLDEYLALRRSLGFKLERAGLLLAQFLTYCEAAGIATITSEVALAWVKLPAGGSPAWWTMRLSVVRAFTTYVQAIDPATQVPPAGVFPAPKQRITPFLYSEADITGLMEAARHLHRPLQAATYETLVGLLAVTGMRVGEAIGLDRSDISWDTGLLVIRDGKFGKSRELPLHPSTVAALRAYARRRDQLCRHPETPSFFISVDGTALPYNQVWRIFARLTRQVGLAPRSERCRPRIHDVRHSFAVRTLLGWYRSGVDVQARLPLLSTYLGHANPKWTYWYLSASPELLSEVAKRLEDALGQLP